MASSWGGSWGTAWADSWGVLSGAGSVTLSGKRANTAIGLLKPTLEIVVLGRSITLAQGAFNFGGEVIVDLTGNANTTSVGLLTPNIAALPAGIRVFAKAGWIIFAGKDSEFALWARSVPDEIFTNLVYAGLTGTTEIDAPVAYSEIDGNVATEFEQDLYAVADTAELWALIDVDEEITKEIDPDLFTWVTNTALFVVTQEDVEIVRDESEDLIAA